MTHQCPKIGCDRDVPTSKLACPRHWATVPADLQRELYAAYDRGRGALSERHLDAVGAVTDFLRGR